MADDDFGLLSGSDDDELPAVRGGSDEEGEVEIDLQPDGEVEAEGEAEPEAEVEDGAEAMGGGEGDEKEDKRQQQLVDMEKIQNAMKMFTPDQLDRYEHYRRSGFPKSQMRRLVQSIAGCSVSLPMAIVMSGLAKMFVGDVVETARIMMSEQDEQGPIRPRHLRQAFRRLKLEGRIPRRTRPSLFR